MRKLVFLCALFFLLLAPPMLAQNQQVTGALTAQDSGACSTANACLVLKLNANSGATIVQLSGTFSATVQFEGTADGANWVSVNGTTIGGTTAVTSATGTGAWQINVAGMTAVRLRVSAYTSGTVQAVITSSVASAAARGGNGASGTVSPGLAHQPAYYPSSGTTIAGFCSVPTTKGIFDLAFNLPTDAAVDPSCLQTGLGGSAITGAATTYTVASTDNLQVVNHDVAGSAAVTVTLPTPTTLENASFGFSYENDSAQMDVITPTTWTINGAASIPVPPNASVRIKVDSFNTNNWLAVYSGSPSRVVNGIAYSAFYPGATLDVRVNACIIDAETGAHGATSHICSSEGEPAILSTSGVGIVNTLSIGDSGQDYVTWRLPGHCNWDAFVTGGIPVVSQYGNSRIIGQGQQRGGCFIENMSVANGASYVYVTQSNDAYYQLDGLSFANKNNTLSSNIVARITGAYDNSSWTNWGLADYVASTTGLDIGSATACCSALIKNFSVYGNNTGGIPLLFGTTSGNSAQELQMENISLGHPAASTPVMSCPNTTTANKAKVTITGLYEESNSTDTTTAINQIAACDFTVHGQTITNIAGTTETAAAWNIASSSYPASLHIDGLQMAQNWSHSIVAVINNNLASPNAAYTGPNGKLTEYNSLTSYSDSIVVATTIYTNVEYSNGTCTTAATIDPANGNRQSITLTASDTCALTFTQPSSKTVAIQLKIISPSGATAGQISGGYWPSGVGFTTSPPTIAAVNGTWAFATCYLDGANANCALSQ